MALVCLARYSDRFEAEAARAVLESGGLHAVVFDSETASNAWHYAFAIGGVRVMVLEDDLEEARTLLALPASPPDASEDLCPSCGSAAVTRLSSWWSFVPLLLLAAAPAPLGWRRRHCRDCGHRWRAKREAVGAASA